MSTDSKPRGQKWVTQWPRWASIIGVVIAGLIGVLSWIRWGAHLDLNPMVNAFWPKSSPATATCMILLAVGLGCQLWTRLKAALVLTTMTIAGAAIVIGVIRIVFYLMRWPGQGVDQLWLVHGPWAGDPPVMSAATAISIILLAAALILEVRQTAFRTFQVIIMTVMFLGWLGLSRHLYGGEHPFFYAAMTGATAIGLLNLSVAILALRTDRGLMGLLTSETSGGASARRMCVLALTVPLLLGWVTQEGQVRGFYDDEAAHSLFAIATVLFFGAAVWLDAAIIDRSDRKRLQVEQYLRTSLKDVRDLQEALDEHAIVAITDPRGRIKYVNDKFCEISKYSREELIGQDHRIVNSGHHPKEFMANLWRTIAQGKVWRGEICNRAKDGSSYWLYTTIVPFLNAEGKPYQYVAIRADITERKLTESRAHSQLERLNLLHQITRAIGERQDLRSIFQVAIASVEEQLPVDFGCVGLYDRERNELVITCVGGRSGRLAFELAMTEDAQVPIDQNGLSRCVRGQLVYEPDIVDSEFPFPKRLARGGLRSLVVAPLQVESNIFGVVVAARRKANAFTSGECEFLRQLSEHVALAAHQSQLHTALQKAYDDLRRSQQTIMQQERLSALGQMASGIAHDINNALSPATLYLSALLEDETLQLDGQTREYLETVQCAIEDVAHTVSRMREFYRPREEQLPLTSVDLNQMVRQVIDLSRVRWKDMMLQRGVEITLRTELLGELPRVTAVESEIREALINLVFNAVDAMPDGGTLTLSTRLLDHSPDSDKGWVGQFAAVEVTDTGAGMDVETRQRCLEPFYTTKGERGTGLGLAMVYGVVQRHCGAVDIDSAPGRGTTIRLSFPLPMEGVEEPGQLPVKRQALTRRLRLLVVDDDPLLLKSLGDILEADGHSVVTAQGGQAGIDWLQKVAAKGESFSALFTDLGMPKVDGRKVAIAAKAVDVNLPVIMLTGWGERLAAEGEKPECVDRILSKPPKLREIRAVLEECCLQRTV